MSRTGNYKTAFDTKKAEIHKLTSIAKYLELKQKLNFLQLKYAKAYNVLPLAIEGVAINCALASTFVQIQTVQAQPLFPKGGIICGEGKPEIHH